MSVASLDPWLRGVDAALFLSVLLFAWIGAVRGLAWQVVRLVGVVAALAVARALAPRAASWVGARFPGLEDRAAHAVAWCATLALALALVSVLLRLVREDEVAPQLGLVDRAGGALAGALAAVVLHVGIVVAVCGLGPREWSIATLSGTQSQRLFAAWTQRVPLFVDAQAAATLRPWLEPR